MLRLHQLAAALAIAAAAAFVVVAPPTSVHAQQVSDEQVRRNVPLVPPLGLQQDQQFQGVFSCVTADCLTVQSFLDTARRAEKIVDDQLGSTTQMSRCGQLNTAMYAYTQAAAYGLTTAAADAKRVLQRIDRECPSWWIR